MRNDPATAAACARIAEISRFRYNARMRVAKFCIVLALLLAFAPAAPAEPKAYDLIKYRGKAQGLTIAFDFAAGYPEASEVRIKNGRRGKSTRFRLVEGDELRFVPEKNGAGSEELTIEGISYDGSDEKVNGVYRAGGKTIRFTLTAQEN